MGAAVSASSGHMTAPPARDIVIVPSKTTPDFETGKTTADPNYGFEGKRRKERVVPVTMDELVSTKIEPRYRDYCVGYLIKFKKCNKDNFPFYPLCKHEKHALEHCQYEEYLIRMKEYERERRLLHRKQRKEAKAKKQHYED